MMLLALLLSISSYLAAFVCAEPETEAGLQGRYVACQPIGSDCSVCGYGYEVCGGSICYNPEAGESCCQSSWSCPSQSACGTSASICTRTLVATYGEPSPTASPFVESPYVPTVSLTTSLTGTTTLTLVSSPSAGAGETSSYGYAIASTTSPGYATASAGSASTSNFLSFESSPPASSNSPPAYPVASVNTTSTLGLYPTSMSTVNTTSSGPALVSSTLFNATATPTTYPVTTQTGSQATGNSVPPVSTSLTIPIATSTTAAGRYSTTSAAPSSSPATAKAAGRGKVSFSAALIAMLMFGFSQ